LLKWDKNVIALHMETVSMFIIIFQYIATGKTEVSEEYFIQIDNTNFLSNTSFFLPEFVLFIKLRKPLYLPTGWP